MDEMKDKIVEIPVTEVITSVQYKRFVLHKKDYNGRIYFSKEEASLLMIELYKFVMEK